MCYKTLLLILLIHTLLHMQIDCEGNGGKDSCKVKGLAVYNLTFEGKWSEDVFYKQYPLFRPNAQWSKVLGRTHSKEYTLWRFDSKASSSLKIFAELGSSDEYDKTEKQGGGGILDIFHVDPVTFGVGRTWALFFADMEHHLLSTATKIVPGPDWFVGVDSLNLCTNNRWLESKRVELYPIDAGTDKGFTFTAPNWLEVPFRPIFQITSKFPSHPANSFFYPEMDHLPPMAELHIQRLDWYDRIDDIIEGNDIEETEIKEENIISSTPFENEIINNVVEKNVTKLEAILEMIKSAFSDAKIIDDENRRDIVIKIPSERKRRRNRNKRKKFRVSSKEQQETSIESNIINTPLDQESESYLTEFDLNNYSNNINNDMTHSTTNSSTNIQITSITRSNKDHNGGNLDQTMPNISSPIVDIYTPTDTNTMKITAAESKIKTVKLEKIKNATAGKKAYMASPTEISYEYKDEKTSTENTDPTEESFAKVSNSIYRSDEEFLQNNEPPPARLRQHNHRKMWDSLFPTTTHTILNDYIYERNPVVENSNEKRVGSNTDTGEQNEETVNWQPVNCVLSNEWGPWSPCSKSCGYGTRSRVKLIASSAQNGGRNCEQEPVLELCGTMRTCSQWKHFSFDNWGMGSDEGDHLKLKENDNVLT